MEPSIAIPLHFTLEFAALAGLGGIIAFQVQAGKRLGAGVAALALIAQIVHTGEFTGSRWLLVAAAATAVAAAAFVSEQDRRLWWTGWSAFAASNAALALLAPHGAPTLDGSHLTLHLVKLAGAGAIAAWAWRRGRFSVRLRIGAAFVLVLVTIVLVAGGALARVVTENAKNVELNRLATQVRAQLAVIDGNGRDLVNRAASVSQTFGQAVAEKRDLNAIASGITDRVFTDLGFVAVFSNDRSLLAQSRMTGAERSLARSEAVTAALRGEIVFSMERTPEAIVQLGAAPVYAPGPQSVSRIVAAVVLGRRLDAAATIAVRQSDLEVAVVSPSGGRVIAASGPSISGLRLPRPALQALGAGGSVLWRGPVRIGDERFFVVAAPLARPDGSIPGLLIVAAPDRVLADAALDVSRALFAAVLAASLISLLIAMWIGARLSRPIIELTRTAQRVEAGDLDAQPPLPGVDEIGTLSRAFGRMTSALRETIDAEQQTRMQLETVVGGIGEGLVSMDQDFVIQTFNPAAESVCGVPAAEAVGRKCFDVYGDLTKTPGGERICDTICPLRFGGGRERPVSIAAADGVTRQLAVTCSVLRDEEGNVAGGVDLLRDVTPEVQAEELKTNVLSNISHELRTPLTGILGFGSMLKRPELSAQSRTQAADEVVREARKLERIVEMLVNVAAMDAGRIFVRTAEVDVASLVRDAAKRWNQRTSKHTVTAKVARELRPVAADARLISKALDELLDNAVKFSPDGGPITVAARQREGLVEVSVTDKGVGLDPKNPALFEDFSQADPSATRRFGGMGLGLSFVRRVVAAHHGEVSVRGRPGRGAAFSILLPS